jgi:7-cyano-7-deazaguanine reductase
VSDPSILLTFPNPQAARAYLIEHHVQEFTSLCPNTAQPDFATLTIRYVAAETCIELKSLKLYLQGFRNKGVFYEDVTNIILGDLVACCEPKWMVVISHWSVRGGIRSTIRAQHGQPPMGLPAAD